MEMENERFTTANKHGKKKIHLIRSILSNGGEGGITRLLVFGGALAVAGFMAVASFASNKNKEKRKVTQSHDHLRDSTTQDGDAACRCTSKSRVSSSDLVSNPTLILEEKIDLKPKSEEHSPTCFHNQEIVFYDDSHPDSAASSNKDGAEEECLASLFNSPSFQAQEANKDEPPDGQNSLETETEEDGDINEDDDVDVVESDSALESAEEDSSKSSGSTSLDSNEEPIWPAELIEEPDQEFKGDKAQGTAKTNSSASANYFDSQVCSDSDADDVTPEATLNEKANFSLVLRTSVMPMLLLALLLLLVLLTHRPQESFYVLDDGGNSVISPMK